MDGQLLLASTIQTCFISDKYCWLSLTFHVKASITYSLQGSRKKQGRSLISCILWTFQVRIPSGISNFNGLGMEVPIEDVKPGLYLVISLLSDW